MADIIKNFDGYPHKIKDMGDGTYAPVFSAEVSGGGTNGETEVNLKGTPVTPTNRSGSVTTGNSAQVLMAANANRSGFCVQNLDPTEDLYISVTGTASAAPGSKLIPADGGYYETPATGAPTTAVSVFSTKTGHQFTAEEW